MPLLSARLTSLLGPEGFVSGGLFPTTHVGRGSNGLHGLRPSHVSWRICQQIQTTYGAEPPELIKWLIRINLIRIEKDQMDRGRRKRKENI